MGSLRSMYWAANHPPADPDISFAGKTVLVTGANTGLGFQAAVKYAALGASSLILAVRSLQKGEAAKDEIVRRTGCPPDRITVETVDLNTFASVRDLADRLQSLPRLDVALLNAGVATPTFTVGPEGFETALQVNVLSTALLAILLLPKLRETARKTQAAPHLCFVNSIGSNQVVSDWLDPNRSLIQRINDPSQFNGQKQYALIKLAAFFAMRGVAEHSDNDIIINAVCPGLSKTDLGRSFPWFAQVMMTPFQAVFARTAEEGSRSLVSATALGEESRGKLWTNDQYATMSELVADQKLYRETWEEILSILRQHCPKVDAILRGDAA